MPSPVLAKIAVGDRAGDRPKPRHEPGQLEARLIAHGPGWIVEDIVCSHGPEDRPYDEQHTGFAVSVVTSGTFQYRGSGFDTRELMTPGSLLLGSPGQCFECGHEHGIGDRCLSFRFTPEYFHLITAGTGSPGGARKFRSLRLPPVRPLSPVVAEACAALSGSKDVAWEELGIRLAARALQVDGSAKRQPGVATPAALARVTQSVRTIEDHPAAATTLVGLACEAGLSPFHYLRVFENVTGTTPHQYIRRMRLRAAAARVLNEPNRILDIALDAGFGDVSNFNRAFRAEFGVSPTAYRKGRRL